MSLSILVAMDLSAADRRVNSWLERLRSELRDPVRVTRIHVLPLQTTSTQVPFGEPLELEIREAEKLLQSYGEGEVRIEVGSPGSFIAELSGTYDLVVAGGGERSWLGEAILGSVSQHLMHHAKCPVVIVRPTSGSDA